MTGVAFSLQYRVHVWYATLFDTYLVTNQLFYCIKLNTTITTKNESYTANYF